MSRVVKLQSLTIVTSISFVRCHSLLNRVYRLLIAFLPRNTGVRSLKISLLSYRLSSHTSKSRKMDVSNLLPFVAAY